MVVVAGIVVVVVVVVTGTVVVVVVVVSGRVVVVVVVVSGRVVVVVLLLTVIEPSVMVRGRLPPYSRFSRLLAIV